MNGVMGEMNTSFASCNSSIHYICSLIYHYHTLLYINMYITYEIENVDFKPLSTVVRNGEPSFIISQLQNKKVLLSFIHQ